MRKHYITLCMRGNTEVTHIDKNGSIEVTFERAVNSGFNTLVVWISGEIVSNVGFNKSEVDYYLRFLEKHRSGIIMESRGEI